MNSSFHNTNPYAGQNDYYNYPSRNLKSNSFQGPQQYYAQASSPQRSFNSTMQYQQQYSSSSSQFAPPSSVHQSRVYPNQVMNMPIQSQFIGSTSPNRRLPPSGRSVYNEIYGYEAPGFDGKDVMNIAGHGVFEKVQLQPRTWGVPKNEPRSRHHHHHQKKIPQMAPRDFYSSLVELANLENNIEIAKNKLARCREFNLNYLIYILDRDGKKTIFPHEFQDAIMTNFQILDVTISEIKSFFLQHSQNPISGYQEALDVQQVKEMFQPQLSKRTIDYSSVNNLDSSTSQLIREVLVQHFKAEKFFQKLCERISESRFDLGYIFDEIDEDNSQYITLRELQRILRKYDQDLSSQAGQLLFKRLDKYDPNTNEEISRKEFSFNFLRQKDKRINRSFTRSNPLNETMGHGSRYQQPTKQYQDYGKRKGRIHIKVKRAQIYRTKHMHELNLYCKIQIGNQEKDTIPDGNSGLNPVWNQQLMFHRDIENELVLMVFNQVSQSNRNEAIVIGKLNFNEIFYKNDFTDVKVPLLNNEDYFSNKNSTKYVGQADLQILWQPS